MKLTKRQANEIANIAIENAGYHVTQSIGYFSIWADEDDESIDYAVDVSKVKDGRKEFFAIYVSAPLTDDGWWDYTKTLNKEELSNKLIEIAESIDKEINHKTGME